MTATATRPAARWFRDSYGLVCSQGWQVSSDDSDAPVDRPFTLYRFLERVGRFATLAEAQRFAEGWMVDPVTSSLIDMADAFRSAANAADGDHARQEPGRAYGDAHTALMNLLTLAYGLRAVDVYDVMIDSGIDHEHAASYVAFQTADA